MELPVEKFLQDKQIAYRLIRLNQKAFTVDDVMKYSEDEVKADEICKTIILKGKKSGRKFAVFLRAMHRVDFKEAKKFFGEEMSIASAEDVQEAAGVEPGAVCPFLVSVPLFVDKHVFDLKTVNCGSGDHLYGLEFEMGDLGKIVKYEIVSLAKILEEMSQ